MAVVDEGLRVSKRLASDAGGCNFCLITRATYTYVYVVTSQPIGGIVSVRFCAACRKEFNRQANQAWRT